MQKHINVALIGNPNTGKTSLFNQLTGLQQKVGNYPGITVTKKQGTCTLATNKKAIITDLPGTYSINPTSEDESLVLTSLMKKKEFDVIVIVADVENLKRNLLLFSQVQDFGIPTVLALNMADQLAVKGISIDIEKLEKELDTKIVLISAKKNIGISTLREAIITVKDLKKTGSFEKIANKIDASFFNELAQQNTTESLYILWQQITKPYLSNKPDKNTYTKELLKKYQHRETIYRYQKINEILKNTYRKDATKGIGVQASLDTIFTHKIFGYLIFFSILLVVFQAVFEWASIPMDTIDTLFANITELTKENLPNGKLNNLITDGILPGIGGVVIFIPQIVILFLFIAILEETGYMSRVVFLMDKIMRYFGMSGKSVIPLLSGTACAVPAIMATRTISSTKERLITILVTPFTTCAARLPVYAILIALVIPNKPILGFLNLQGVVMFGLYALGFITAITAAYILHKTLKTKHNSFFVIEMPTYKIPLLKNIALEVFEKTKTFVLDAGKIIIAISIVLWFLASHGPNGYNTVETSITTETTTKHLTKNEIEQKIASKKLEKSYIGIIGKTIEPIVAPIGYDWKIGIGLLSSFAAREVFVGSLATIYSVESDTDDTTTIQQKMASEINSVTGKKRFNLATGVSLLLFYAFAMQCMATLAIVKRETNSWKWPLAQLITMGVLAYTAAFIAYKTLS